VAQILHCCGCGVGWKLQLDPLAWETPYAMDVALKNKKQNKTKQNTTYESENRNPRQCI